VNAHGRFAATCLTCFNAVGPPHSLETATALYEHYGIEAVGLEAFRLRSTRRRTLTGDLPDKREWIENSHWDCAHCLGAASMSIEEIQWIYWMHTGA